MKKRAFKILLAAALVLLAGLGALALRSASSASIHSFYIDGGVTEGEGDHVYLRTLARGEVSLFLPSTVDETAVTPYFDGFVFAGGKFLTSGQSTDAFAREGKCFALFSGRPITLKVYHSDLPAMFVTTESGSFDAIDADKSHKESGAITVADRSQVYYDGELKQIKGRGNATWGMDKKPYNFKLPEAAGLLGMNSAKDWCLLANAADHTFARNQAASYAASLLEMDFAPQGRSMVLYRNGACAGVYTLTEKVEIAENRVDITNLEKLTEKANPDTDLEDFPRGGDPGSTEPGSYKYYDIPADPEDITGGYLLEIELPERYPAEVSGFVTDRGTCIVIKEPEYASQAQVEYIRGYYQEFEDAVYAPDGRNDLGKHYTEYIDLKSFAALYIVEDLSVDLDAAATSSYMFKEAGQPLAAGPVWDFDQAFGHYTKNVQHIVDAYDLTDPATTFVREGTLYREEKIDNLFNALYDHRDFEEAVAALWENNFLPGYPGLMEFIRELTQEIARDIIANHDINGVYSDDDLDPQTGFAGNVAVLTDFLEARTEYLTGYYSQDHSAVPIG